MITSLQPRSHVSVIPCHYIPFLTFVPTTDLFIKKKKNNTHPVEHRARRKLCDSTKKIDQPFPSLKISRSFRRTTVVSRHNKILVQIFEIIQTAEHVGGKILMLERDAPSRCVIGKKLVA